MTNYLKEKNVIGNIDLVKQWITISQKRYNVVLKNCSFVTYPIMPNEYSQDYWIVWQIAEFTMTMTTHNIEINHNYHYVQKSQAVTLSSLMLPLKKNPNISEFTGLKISINRWCVHLLLGKTKIKWSHYEFLQENQILSSEPLSKRKRTCWGRPSMTWAHVMMLYLIRVLYPPK